MLHLLLVVPRKDPPFHPSKCLHCHWLVGCGVVGSGGVWCGVVWCGVVWCGVVWCGVAYFLES